MGKTLRRLGMAEDRTQKLDPAEIGFPLRDTSQPVSEDSVGRHRAVEIQAAQRTIA